MLTVYVDDLLLAGPKEAHKPFWDKLSVLVDIEEVLRANFNANPVESHPSTYYVLAA